MNKRDKIYDVYFKDILNISIESSSLDLLRKIDYIEILLSIVTKFTCENLSKIKAIIGYRFKNGEEINILNNIENLTLNDIENRLLEEVNIFGELFIDKIKKSNIYDDIINYTKENTTKYDYFFKYLIDKMTINIDYIKLSYLKFFYQYTDCNFENNPCKIILYTSIYLEHLKNLYLLKQVSLCSDEQSLSVSNREVSDKNIFIETLVKGSGPFLTKILQRFGNLETIEDEYRTKILKCYEELPKMTKYDIEVVKDFLTSKKQLLDDIEKQKIKEFDFSQPISVASIGQVHLTSHSIDTVSRMSFCDSEQQSCDSLVTKLSNDKNNVILKFVKPRTILYLFIEVLMIKKILDESINIEESLKKKVKDFLYFFAIYIMGEFNFKKEKNNLLNCQEIYKYYENNILKIKCAEILKEEPFSLGGIPYFWMKVSEGETLNKILERKDKDKCKKIIPQMMKLLKIWFISSLFNESEFHVDLHAGNIIVDNDGNLTLIDFGNCCLLNKEDRSALIKCIEWHEKVVKLVNRLIYKGNYNNYSNLTILETIKLGEINQGEILFYVNKIMLELTKIMKIQMSREDFNELVYKTSTEFYMKDSYRTLFGAMTEYMINNTTDIGIFSRSKVLEFSKGIVTLDKTWMQICLLCEDEKLNKNSVNVGFEQLSLIEKLQLYKKILQYK